MKYREAIDILEKHNHWRRSGDGEMVNPTELGLAIDCIIEESKKKVIVYCAEDDIGTFDYDSDGLGVGVRGDARVINSSRKIQIEATPFRGSAAVIDQDHPVPGLRPTAGRDKIERTNKDTFKNFKAQSWWSLRLRFERTYRAVVHGEKFDEAMKADNVPQ